MANQSLVWTTLPNGMAEDGSLRVSVLLSPRLDPETDPPRLSSFFPDWEDWPATLAAATVRLRYGGATVDIPVQQTTGPTRVDTTLGSPDSDVWRAVFHEELGVAPFVFEDHSTDHVLSFDTVAVAQLVAGIYGKLAAEATDEVPSVSDLLDDPDWQALVQAVADLDAGQFDPSSGLRNPTLGFDEFRDGGMPETPTPDRRGEGIPPTELLPLLQRFQLFHTPPSPPKPVEHERDDDSRITAKWLEHERTDLPSEDELVADLDFHTVVSAMQQYPIPLRRLGLVVDLVVEAGVLADAADDELSVEVSFPAGTLTVPRSPDVAPITHARLSTGDGVFAAVSNPLLEPDELRVVDGLLDLHPARFALLQADVDGSGLKLMNLARTLSRLAPEDLRVDPVTRFEKQPGVPSLRTAGLMLVHRGRGRALKARFEDNEERNEVAEGIMTEKPGVTAPQLWAEDLVIGFRFDVWDGITKVWRSLCQREATYELGQGAVVVTADPHEEGIVEMAATTSAHPSHNRDILYLHEAMVLWAGWSLAAPPPGRAVLPDDEIDDSTLDTEAEVPDGIRVETRFKALAGSLPRLRFGRRYWLRGRVVDLAGNSLRPLPGDFGPEGPEQNGQPFLRYEPIAPPAIALIRPEGGTTEVPAEGESMERIAIRTFNDTHDDPTPTDQEARRMAVPTRASVRDAEHHGMLDAEGKVDPTTYAMLAHERDRDADDPNAALVEEKILTAGPLDPQPVETVYAVYREGQELTYLPDPLAETVAVRVFRHPNIDPAEIITVPLYADAERWPKARPFKIRVFEDPDESPSYDAVAHTLLIPVPKGIRAQVRLSMKASPEALEKLGVWSWLTDSERQALLPRALDGQHWMLTPWRTLEIVHGVQRPLIAPEIQEHTIERGRGATNAWVGLETTCSLRSTARLDFLAEWHEPSDLPELGSESEEGPVDQPREDVAFSVKITEPDSYAARLDGHLHGGVPEHAVVGPDRIAVGGFDLVEERFHEFGDTRYRRIEYRLQGTTRFREFLPAHLLTKTVDGEEVPTEEHISVEGPSLVTWIRSSAPPPAPKVLYVVPTFGWVRTGEKEGDLTRWRRGGGLRVYLDRPWMVSGYGEMLGVVLPPASFAADPETSPQASPYKNYVTQWGNDPIWKSSFVPGIAPTRGDFPLARTTLDPSGAWLPKGAPPEEADQPPHPFRVTNLLPPGVPTGAGAGLVEVAPHDVHYDQDRRLWYCDIEVSPRWSYFPFIRLALARYQPVSLDVGGGTHLSPVVLADFMQLAPDRWLHVNQTDDPRSRRVVLYGLAPTDSSGAKEVKSAHTPTPIEFSGRGVVEVWVEKLDVARGEDFGWVRVTGAAVQPDAGMQAIRSAGAGRFVPGNQIARALELHSTRQFQLMAREQLIDALFIVPPLWSGTVTLPADADPQGRYRLVVAEFEEYLLDGPSPYYGPPQEKGRRLVFVEHVELA